MSTKRFVISGFCVFFSILVVIGSFTPTISVQGLIPTSTLQPTAFPDDFNNAQPVTLPTTIVPALFSPSSATTATDDPVACVAYGHSIWYKYTATTSGQVTVDTEGTGFNTVVAIYTGTRGSLTQVACNDDQAGTLDQTSWVDFNAVSGTTYYIMIGSFGSTSPNGWLTFKLSTVANDYLTTAKWAYPANGSPFTYSQNIYGSTVSTSDPNLRVCLDRCARLFLWALGRSKYLCG